MTSEYDDRKRMRERDVTIELEKEDLQNPTNNNVVARFSNNSGYFVGRRVRNFEGNFHVFVHDARSVTKIVSSKIDTSEMKECTEKKTTVWCRGRRHTALL